MSKQMQSFHMLAEADYFCDLARKAYWFEDNEKWAVRLLRDAFYGINDKQINKIINGDALVTGWSVCDEPKCSQCKGLDGCRYEEKTDETFKLEILKRKLWLNETHIKVGQFHIDKSLVIDLVQAIAQRNKLRSNGKDETEYHDETIQITKTSFWSTNGYKKPNERFMPSKNSIHYTFTETIVPFLDEVETESKYLLVPDWYEEVTKPIFKKYAVIKEPLKEDFTPKPKRAEGYMLVEVIDPKTRKYRHFNLPKEYYLRYLDERLRSIEQQQILMHRDTDSEKIMKAFTKLEEKVGDAHEMMMNSINLWHSPSGGYDHDMVECYVNAILQWYMFHIALKDKGSIERLPDRLALDKNDNAYVDGKLIEKRIDLR